MTSKKFTWKLISSGVGIISVFFSGFLILHKANVPLPGPIPAAVFFSNVASPSNPETANVPAGTKIQIRLDRAINPQRTSQGDPFVAHSYGPLWIEGKFIAPSRSEVTGQFLMVDAASDQRPASVTLVLQKIILNSREYKLDTQPLTLLLPAAGNADSAVATADRLVPGDARNGAGAGRSISLLTFTLSAPVELPVIRKIGEAGAGKGLNTKFLSPSLEGEDAND